MNPDEARDNIGQLVIWQPNERPLPVRIVRVIDEHTYGYHGPPRVAVRLDGYMSETDVDPEQLQAHDVEACRRVLIDAMAEMGVEVWASTERPHGAASMAYDPNPMMCPHGVTFYMQPTNEQILEWEREGTP